MQTELSPDDIETIICECDAAARRLWRKLALPAADLDDLRQDLLVDLIRRLPGFDKRRGSIGAFAGLVLRNQCSRLAIRHHRRRQAQGGTALSLDAPVAGSAEPLGCLLSESDGLATWHGQDTCAIEDAETRHDLARVLGQLPAEARVSCAALCVGGASELASRFGISRSTAYRRIAELRVAFALRGFGGRWDGLDAA